VTCTGCGTCKQPEGQGVGQVDVGELDSLVPECSKSGHEQLGAEFKGPDAGAWLTVQTPAERVDVVCGVSTGLREVRVESAPSSLINRPDPREAVDEFIETCKKMGRGPEVVISTVPGANGPHVIEARREERSVLSPHGGLRSPVDRAQRERRVAVLRGEHVVREQAVELGEKSLEDVLLVRCDRGGRFVHASS
jgi:hypothetical protein